MKMKLFASVAFAALVALGGCTQNRHCGTVGGKNVCGNSELVRTSDGRYGMWGPDGFWYWYMLSSLNSSGNHYYYGTGLGVPTGGTWTKSQAPDQTSLADSETVPLDTSGTSGSFSSGVATDVEEEATSGSYSSGGSSSGNESTSGSYSSGGTSDESGSSSGSYSSGGSDESSSGSSSSPDESSSGSYSSGGDPEGGSSSSDSGSYSSGSDSSSSSSDSGSYSSGGDPE